MPVRNIYKEITECPKCKDMDYSTYLQSPECDECWGLEFSIDSLREHTNADLLKFALDKMTEINNGDDPSEGMGDDHIEADRLLCILLIGLKLSDDKAHSFDKIRCDIIENFNGFRKWYV